MAMVMVRLMLSVDRNRSSCVVGMRVVGVDWLCEWSVRGWNLLWPLGWLIDRLLRPVFLCELSLRLFFFVWFFVCHRFISLFDFIRFDSIGDAPAHSIHHRAHSQHTSMRKQREKGQRHDTMTDTSD